MSYAYHNREVRDREAKMEARGLGYGQPGGAWLLIWNRLVMGAVRDAVAAKRRLEV